MARSVDAPAGVERHGLSREDAAFMVGVSPTYFDQLVERGLMPKPRRLGERRKIWLRAELMMRLADLPAEGEAQGDSWSDVA